MLGAVASSALHWGGFMLVGGALGYWMRSRSQRRREAAQAVKEVSERLAAAGAPADVAPPPAGHGQVAVWSAVSMPDDPWSVQP